VKHPLSRHTPLFNEWRDAESAARSAERELYEKMLCTARGGPAPELELIRAVADRRAKAHSLFDAAMQEMKQLAESLHHQRSGR
jgi:hypothetical protein